MSHAHQTGETHAAKLRPRRANNRTFEAAVRKGRGRGLGRAGAEIHAGSQGILRMPA
ncbi:hypothetical protein AwMethylo_11570 [Methylobacterium sp.]|nr:hypothetical protein AwMethylo_11570 [Methylobacterium sp.]